jgi:hypothetical protein
MGVTEASRTVDLIASSRVTCRRSTAAVDDLKQVWDEVQETVRFLRWWRFLDYDPKSAEFLQKLDMSDDASRFS